MIWCGLIRFFRSRASLEADPSPSPSAQCPAVGSHPSGRPSAEIDSDICQAIWLGAERAERRGDREARNRNPLAPRGLSLVLPMEVKITRLLPPRQLVAAPRQFPPGALAFPGRHDDQVDALTQGLAWGRVRRGGLSVHPVVGMY